MSDDQIGYVGLVFIVCMVGLLIILAINQGWI